VLGRFLEIGVRAPDVRESLEFYESLGFTQAQVGETWAHPYAVITDGRLYLGLHGEAPASPILTYVHPNLREHVQRLRNLPLEFEREQFGQDEFNRVLFRDPSSNLAVQILEARTFSPPAVEVPSASACGYFAELGLPAKDFVHAGAFWEPLGFVAWEAETQPFPRLSLTSDRLNLGLYNSRALRAPTLTFQEAGMSARIEQLASRGYSLSEEMPDALAVGENAVLIAPEGTRLLLLTAQV
jgi:catechol 2,3-dioxygenase-like lactoylglutathione lyase family enzyme